MRLALFYPHVREYCSILCYDEDMNQRTYYTYAGALFAIIAILHLVRIAQKWPAVINDVSIPLWASGVAVLLAGYMAYWGFRSR